MPSRVAPWQKPGEAYDPLIAEPLHARTKACKFVAHKPHGDGLPEVLEDPQLAPLLRGHAQRDPSLVGVNFCIYSFGDVDAQKGSFRCDFGVKLVWFDRKAPQDTGKVVPLNKQQVEELRVPQIEILHSLEESTVGDPRVSALNGVVNHFQRYRCVLEENFELAHFPFDEQLLQVVVRMYRHEDKEAEDGKPRKFKRLKYYELKEGCRRQDWAVYEPYMCATGPSEWPDSVMTMGLKVTRKWPSYVFNIIFVQWCVALLTFMSFALDDLSERAGITSTFLLTTIAFRFAVIDKMPKVSYLTWLDKFMLGCLLIQVTIMLVEALPQFLPESHRELAVAAESQIALGLFGFASVCTLAQSIWACYHVRSRKQDLGDAITFQAAPGRKWLCC